MRVLGIDPGLSGALALFITGRGLVETYEIPTAKSSGRGREVLWSRLSEEWHSSFGNVDHLFLERVSARPGQGVSSMFKFGMVYGGLIAMAAVKSVPITLVSPTVWMKSMGVGKGSKEASVIRASQLFPDMARSFRGLRGGRKDGVAEAALIAKYGHDRMTGIS